MTAKTNPAFFIAEGSGPAVILIHGVGAAADAWRFIVPALSKKSFTLIRYDLRGHGESPPSSAPFSLADLTADLEEIRRRTGYKRAHIVGHSLGAMIAALYAREYPDKVISLGMLSTAAFRTEDDRAKVKAVVAAIEKNGVAREINALVARWFSDEFIAAHPNIVAARRKQVIDTNADAFLNAFRVYAETEMSPWLGQIKSPALVLTGEEDAGCAPRLNRQIAAALPNAELKILPRRKHAVLLEAPDEVAAHLCRFLSAQA
jgi:pimeloyl-ACP methyl ester carboxylesterase